MTALAPISHKLDPLVRRLASDKDGEVLACVAALKRQLAKVGLDFNDLAGMLAAPEAAAKDDALPVFSDYAAAVEWLLASDRGDLADRDFDFLVSMRGILRRFEPRPKQAAWIRGLVERLGGHWT